MWMASRQPRLCVGPNRSQLHHPACSDLRRPPCLGVCQGRSGAERAGGGPTRLETSGVDAEGEVLDVLVQSKRNAHAALKLMRKLLKKYAFAPERLVTDNLRSYGSAERDLGPESRRERGRWKNNRAENSHQPTRPRERKSAGSARKFLSSHAAVHNTFNVQRHLTSAQTHRALRNAAMTTWRNAVAAV
jgi:hypothetical protein